MSLIYEPKGRAREYSPLAINLYSGCNHGCRYCYVPRIFFKDREEFRTAVTARATATEKELEKEISNLSGSRKHVLFSFTTDPYCAADDEHRLTRTALEKMHTYQVPAAVLTKAGTKCLRDLELYRLFGRSIKVGATLTFFTRDRSLEWEPYAAVPEDRLEALGVLHAAGVFTWASFEPVIDPEESLAIMRESLPVVDEYRVGKLNQFEGLDKMVDWTAFLSAAVDILRGAGKRFYVKADLRAAAPSISLTPEECDMDRTIDEPFSIGQQLSLMR